MPTVPSTSTAQSAVSEQKSKTAFRTIAEVAKELNLEAHVLRFWETKFNKIKPMKLRGGRRYYRPEDIVLIRDIKELLYDKGYTIRGVQKILHRKGGIQELAMAAANDAHPPAVNDPGSPQIAPLAPPPTQSELQRQIESAVANAMKDAEKKHQSELAEWQNKFSNMQSQSEALRQKIESLQTQLAQYRTNLRPVISELEQIKGMIPKSKRVS